MFKLGLIAALTAAVCFSIASATGLGAGSVKAKVITIKVGDITTLPSDNFHCQVITKTQVACGAKLGPKSIQVYYAPHQLEVLQFKTATKAAVLLNIKR
jgi:hypothetical protein